MSVAGLNLVSDGRSRSVSGNSPSTPHQQQQQQQQQQNVAVAEVDAFVKYLRRILPALLDDDGDGDEVAKTALTSNIDNPGGELDKALQLRVNLDLFRKFISDFAVNALFVKRTLANLTDDAATSSSSTTTAEYVFSLMVHYDASRRSASVALIKCTAIIEANKRFGDQIRSISLGGGACQSPYETLYGYISQAVSPYLKSYLKQQQESGALLGGSGSGSGGDANAVAAVASANAVEMANAKLEGPGIEKKLAELELGLLKIHQNADIPECQLAIHPLVASILRTCAHERRRPHIDDYSTQSSDSQLLNQLQAGVNKWIREIQNVYK